MTKLYYEKDADLGTLKGRTVAVVGYGIQGRAQALNLHDSGVDVVVGLRPKGESWNAAQKDGLEVAKVSEAVASADVAMMLVPDEVQPEVYRLEVGPYLKEGAALEFAHGFNIRYGTIQPSKDVDVIMVAPKAPGAAVRENFLRGSGVPALLAVHQDATGNAHKVGLAIAKGLGSTKVGVIETTFTEETETDLFGEQADLCGGASELIKAAFDVLVKAGYQPELAYFEVLHELKMIVDLIQAGGIENMWANVSNTAEYGGRTRGPKVIDDHVRKNMEALLKDIKSGAFAQDWIQEYKKGMPTLAKGRKNGKDSQLEQVGRDVRRMFT
ncbi:MAG: ketol-acid reductoisomerase [Candidatus Thermoplasmatota archaeon]